MTTLNHDTKLEEILTQFKQQVLSKDTGHGYEQTMLDLSTYLYKQTLELIGPNLNNIKGSALKTWMNNYRDQLRKAAAERWGQE